jgi:hypothetical protein
LRIVDVHQDAAADIRTLRAADPEAAAVVLTVLEQIDADPAAINKLTTYGDNEVGDTLLNVKPWNAAGRQRNLWRLRMLDTPATSYRVVYGYHWPTRQLCVLAVVHKDAFDYDDLNSALARRIIRAWSGITS